MAFPPPVATADTHALASAEFPPRRLGFTVNVSQSLRLDFQVGHENGFGGTVAATSLLSPFPAFSAMDGVTYLFTSS
ncbi:MAG TPA: hypothetical protein VHS80_06850 [Chthoniobacterales bacterium]|jgi:hypothetical protein|nr:hypothetical protein [Chthoniobacterales bacterium]